MYSLKNRRRRSPAFHRRRSVEGQCIGNQCILIWTTAHAGIPGDKSAKQAAKSKEIDITLIRLDDFKNYSKQVIGKEWIRKWGTLTT